MNYEKSCGAIVYRKYHGNTEILLIKHNKSGYWSFPKGHMEKDETEAETALREIKEETGIDVLVDTGFRETVAFSPRKETIKTVVYFVARAINYDFVLKRRKFRNSLWKSAKHSQCLHMRMQATVTKAKSFIALMK